MKRAGCEVRVGKHTALKPPGCERFIRLDSLGDGYSETDIEARLNGTLAYAPKPKTAKPQGSAHTPKLLIDIEEKVRQGYGGGFVQYAKIQNLKEAARTLIFLQENGIGTYEELVKKEAVVSSDYHKMGERRKAIEERLSEISALQKHIGDYGKGRELYTQYKAKKYSQAFFEEHRAALTLHKAAKRHFDELGLKKLPSMNSLRQEYAALLAERKSLGDLKAARGEMIAWAMARRNVDVILGGGPTEKRKTHECDAR
jgi:hypothetical protein